MPERKPRRGFHADPFSWSLRPGRSLAVLVVAGLGVLLSRGLSLAADAKFVSLAQGTAITGTRDVDYAGTFNIDVGPPFDGPLTEAYCVDLNYYIDIGDIEPQVTPDYPCQVVYILNTYYPQAVPVLAPTSHEAAAVQAAIWFFTDGYVISGPADIKTRAEAIITAAQGSNCVPVPVVPQSLAVTPASATNFLPDDKTHSVLATLIGTDTLPLANYPITIDVTGVSGGQSFPGTTDGSGQFTINYTNTSAVAGSDTITAYVTFAVPVGLKFKLTNKQGIVLAGNPVTGRVQGTAQKNWVPAACGDGFVNQAGELCDDGNPTDGDGCDSNCTPTACGNGITTSPEVCDDGNLIDGDDCDSNCTPTGCGNGVATAGESCDDGNQVNGDGCDNNCTTTACGNGVVTLPELCDDGNTIDGDGCSSNCIPETCGDGIIQPGLGEQCEPPNTPGCDANCHATEICTDLVDNDGNGQIDCLDDDCDCLPIGRDPGVIRFGPADADDLFVVHGSIDPKTPLSPTTEGISFRLTNADGEIFRFTLPSDGGGKQIGRNVFRFRNRLAQVNRSGLARFDLRYYPRRKTFTFVVRVYGDLSLATKADMAFQLVIGDDAFLNESTWVSLPSGGWILTLPGE